MLVLLSYRQLAPDFTQRLARIVFRETMNGYVRGGIVAENGGWGEPGGRGAQQQALLLTKTGRSEASSGWSSATQDLSDGSKCGGVFVENGNVGCSNHFCELLRPFVHRAYDQTIHEHQISGSATD